MSSSNRPFRPTVRVNRLSIIEDDSSDTVNNISSQCQVSKVTDLSVTKNFPDCVIYSVLDPSLSEGVFYVILSKQDQKIYVTSISEKGVVNIVDLHVLKSRFSNVDSFERDCLTVPLSDESINTLKLNIKSSCDELERDYNFLKTPSQSDVYKVSYEKKPKRPFFPEPKDDSEASPADEFSVDDNE